MIPQRSDYLVIGGGLVGLATALKLQRRFPGATVTVLEKEFAVGSPRALTTAARCTARAQRPQPGGHRQPGNRGAQRRADRR